MTQHAELNNLSLISSTLKPVLSGHSKRRPKIGFQDYLLLNAGQKYCRMLQESILQYFPPSLSYHMSLRPLFCLFLSDCLRQVLLFYLAHLAGKRHKSNIRKVKIVEMKKRGELVKLTKTLDQAITAVTATRYCI